MIRSAFSVKGHSCNTQWL